MAKSKYQLKLFIHGEPDSEMKIALWRICMCLGENYYSLKIIDVSKNPEIALNEGVVVTPTLIKSYPLPLKHFAGDLSNAKTISDQIIGNS